MKPCFIDLHIHTSENSNDINEFYNVDILLEKVRGISKTNNFLISLTDHNRINKSAYINLHQKISNFLVGVELHILNYPECSPYHCHLYFNLDKQTLEDKEELEKVIDKINDILIKLYSNAMPSSNDKIPTINEVIREFTEYDFLILPHGGQSHKTFDKSIPKQGVKFDTILERSIYFNLFDGFTARSNKGLEITQEYFKRLGINNFINLITSSDNYNPNSYPNCKTSGDQFVPTWMYSKPTFNGLRVALSESMRLSYGDNPREEWQEQIKKVELKNNLINIDVMFEPGLNVIIGNSSSGKTLLVDSIIKKMHNETDNSQYITFGINDLYIDNPSSMMPHYFSQNYISTIIDKNNESNKSLKDNPLLKQIFPIDKAFVQKSSEMLSKLRNNIDKTIDAVEEIYKQEQALCKIPAFVRLINLGKNIVNPISTFKPNDKEINSLTYENYNEHIEKLDSIEKDSMNLAFCDSIKDEINAIKTKLTNAYKEICFANELKQIILSNINNIDSQLKKDNLRVMQIQQDKENLYLALKSYKQVLDDFYKNLNELAQYNICFETKRISSSGHTLFISNNLKISKDILLESMNKYLKEQIPSYESIEPKYLFISNTKQKNPKVKDYNDLKEKIFNEISSMNETNYEILYKGIKDFYSLSPGLKSSVILDIILGYDDDHAPLIIDQPEDNLATNYINSGLIDAIKKAKSRKQIIMVSHNATIPMLGDAQNIIICKNENNFITIKSYLLEDDFEQQNVTDVIADLTDGGKPSIKKRFKKYNIRSYVEAHNDDN